MIKLILGFLIVWIAGTVALCIKVFTDTKNKLGLFDIFLFSTVLVFWALILSIGMIWGGLLIIQGLGAI